jgi:hypothetical protein
MCPVKFVNYVTGLYLISVLSQRARKLEGNIKLRTKWKMAVTFSSPRSKA